MTGLAQLNLSTDKGFSLYSLFSEFYPGQLWLLLKASFVRLLVRKKLKCDYNKCLLRVDTVEVGGQVHLPLKFYWQMTCDFSSVE